MMSIEEDISKARFDDKRAFFASGATLGYDFRLRQLKTLKRAIQQREGRIQDALADDFGKPVLESYMTEIGILYGEIDYAIRRLSMWMRPRRIYGGLALLPTRFEVRKEPKGVALIVGPWNYPFQLIISPLVGSIAAGNCAVLKPSNVTTRVSELITEMIGSIFQPEYISAVTGPGSTIVPELMSRYRFDHVFFTGSQAVGSQVAAAAAESLTSVTLELGGKSPAIVDEGVDLRDAARRIAWAKCINAGQTCVAPDYVLVRESVKSEFAACYKEALIEFFGPEPKDSPDLARIVNDHRFDVVTSYLVGATILAGGSSDRASRYVEPSLIDEPSLDSPVMSEEIFGPILPILAFSDAAQAKTIIERNPFPLALYLFSSDRAFIEDIFVHVRFGGGCLGNVIVHLSDPRVPFGGVGNSGLGNYHGESGFNAFSHEKTLAFSGPRALNSFAFPPYTKRKESLLRFLFK
jgi:aldehyde dehydrogenase (NAD+)